MSSWHRFQLLCIWNKFILIRLKRVKTQTCLESIVPTYLKRLTFKSGVMLIWNHLPRRWFYPDSFQMECRKPSCQNRFGTLSTWSKLKLFFLGMKLDQFVYETGVYTYWGAMTYLWGKFLWTSLTQVTCKSAIWAGGFVFTRFTFRQVCPHSCRPALYMPIWTCPRWVLNTALLRWVYKNMLRTNADASL